MPDFACLKGDRKSHQSAQSSSGGSLGARTERVSGLEPARLSSGLPTIGDSCDNCGEHRTEGGVTCATGEQKQISYSVKYFNYTVSTSEDECDNVTVSLNRMKIRRSSRERNENLIKEKDRQA